MQEIIVQDFEFDITSLIYGKFLQECHESMPEIKLTDVTTLYPDAWKNPHMKIFSVAVPSLLADVLKLRFGHHMKKRPEPKKEEDAKDIFQKLKKKKITSPWIKEVVDDATWDEYKKSYDKYKNPVDYVIDYKTRLDDVKKYETLYKWYNEMKDKRKD